MKKYLLIILVMLFIISSSCSNFSKNSQIEGKSNTNADSNITISENENKKNVSKNNLLNGVWAENEIDNALFFIKNGYLYYTEDQDNAIPIELTEDTLIIKNELAVYCKILKLNNDSLWFTDQFSNDTTKLIKR